mgnify:CR=1 FL=1
MLQQFYPTMYSESAYAVDFQTLYRKGYRGLLTDVDNTLVSHGAPSTGQSEAFFCHLRKMGWKTCIISNNDEERVRPFAEASGSLYVCHAGKPKTDGYRQGMELMETNRSNTVLLGDQMFTDIWGANRTGIKSILVKPVARDYKVLILLKRAGESVVKRCYFRYARKHPGQF